jgi:hypothetical protein
MPSADEPLKGFAPLLAAVAIVSMATGTLRLKLETWLYLGRVAVQAAEQSPMHHLRDTVEAD